MLDVAAPLTLLGQCLGRFACYAGHCCYGITVEWNVFPFSYSYDGVTYHLGNPFIEAMCSFVGFVVLFSLSLSKKKSFNGCILSLYCIWYGVERCIIEQFRAPGQKLLLTGGYGEGFGMSQFTSLLIAAFGVIWIAQYIVRAKIAKKKLMIFVDKDKLSDEYFEYGKTIYAHPHVDEEGRPIKSDPVAAAETEEKGQ
ncbi:MAG TPA: prolipoprotein diacylglyceryl transferase, partial [Candidatus Protoclostridium stercorigallinarum]|nr:prolipoprotein diacylglyceryl transferase [Candidatus Protoclostridium stercorigallinarum]